MPERRGKPWKGDRRIDMAIDHFAAMGYDARVIRAVFADLLKVYGGGPDAWRLLEDDAYEIVQDRLFEIEGEEKQQQEQQLLLEHHHQQDGQQEQVEDEPPQHQELAAVEEVEDPMLMEPQDIISISEVYSDVPEEEVEGPMFIESPEEAKSAAAPADGPSGPAAAPDRQGVEGLSGNEDDDDDSTN